MTHFEKNLHTDCQRQVLAWGTLGIATLTMTFSMTPTAALFVLAAATFVVGNFMLLRRDNRKVRRQISVSTKMACGLQQVRN